MILTKLLHCCKNNNESGDRSEVNHLYTNNKWHVKQEHIQIVSPDPRRGMFGEM